MTDPTLDTTSQVHLSEASEILSLQDDELAVNARQTPEAFEQLYLLHVQPVYRYLYSKLGNRADAEDATAETFLSALKSIGTYRQKGHFTAWLFTIARNKAVDFYRKQRPVDVLDEDSRIAMETDVLQQVIHNQRREALADLITALPEQEKELLRLRFTAGMTFLEISQLLHRNLSSVKKSIYRSLARLERQLEEYHD